MSMTVSASSGVSWNGPVCQTCSRPYFGTHKCSPEDLMDRAVALMRLARLALERMDWQPTVGPPDGRQSALPADFDVEGLIGRIRDRLRRRGVI